MLRIFLSLGFLTIGISTQVPPKAVLVDEFGAVSCEDLLARTDNFDFELRRDPIAIGYVIIDPLDGQPRWPQIRRKLVSATLRLRGLDSDRFRFFLGNSKGGKTQFWLIPAGAQMPTEGFSEFDEGKSNIDRPVLIGSVDELNICPTFVPRTYANLLLNNPGSTGKIIVEYRKQSERDRWQFATDWIDEFVVRNSVPRNRLRLIFRRGGESLNAEFWFVPAKKK